MLTAVPSYIVLADFGVVSAASNKMAMAAGTNDFQKASKVFQAAIVFVFIVAFSLCATSIALVLALDLFDVLEGYYFLITALTFTVALTFFNGLSEAALRCSNEYALGIYLGAGSRLFEWVGNIIGLLAYREIEMVVLGGFIARLLAVFIAVGVARSKSKVKWGWGLFDKSELRSLATPAFSFFIFPVASAISLQGLTILVGLVLGPAALSIFSVYRTIGRVCVQAIAIFGYSFGPEFSMLYGGKNFDRLRTVYASAVKISLLVAAGISIFVLLASKAVLGLWTHGKIDYDFSLMLLMVLYALFAGVWNAPRVLVFSINKSNELVLFYLAISVLMIFSSYGMALWVGVQGVISSTILAEILLAVFFFRSAARFLKEDG